MASQRVFQAIEAAMGALPDSTVFDRAVLVEAVVRAVYEHVKFNAPEGGGHDGRDDPEREGLEKVLDAATEHKDATR